MTTINVTACDNELVILAYQWTGSFEIARIKSGNNQSVNVSINIKEGQYQGGVSLNGVNSGLSGTYDVYLAAGQYSLTAAGINWGAVGSFTVDLLGGETETYAGVAYTPDPVSLTV